MVTTTNYGWVKPVVGGDDDAWGGELNTDLDGIDSTVKGVSNVANAALPLAGGTLSGNLTVTPPAGISAQQVIGDNRIINGDMRIDQRWNGSSGTAANVYTIDRWTYSAAQVGKGTWGRSAGFAPGFPYCLGFTSSSAYTALAGDNFNFLQPIEADMVSDFAWGTANAQPATLSFWANSSLGGTSGGAIRNQAGTRSYPFTYTLVANTWTKIVLTIPADTGGTWVMSGNAASVWVCFDLGTGATYRGPPGAWASANYLAATGAVSVVGTNAATFYLTGVKLEIGSVATPYPRQSLARSLADCQRYYQGMNNLAMFGGGVAGQWFGQTINLPVSMRAAPTIAFGTTSYTNASAIGSGNQTGTGFFVEVTATATAQTSFNTTYTASAEL